MAGRQIRWPSVGRAAAIGLAVVAAIAALPALLGSGSPPPVPDDVGLAPRPPIAVSAPVAAPRPPEPKKTPPVKPRRRIREHAVRRPRNPRRRHESTVVPTPVYVPPIAYTPP